MDLSPEEYFIKNDLYNVEKLKKHCEENFVYVITSVKYPNLVMLHYMDECQYEKKWTDFSRMSRGLIIDVKHKKIVAYPFAKFFNLGEMPETKYEELEKFKEFEVTEKIDGSMIILFQDPETQKFHTTTKGSFDSDHGAFAEQYIPEHLKDSKLINDYTLIFELINSKFRIVVNYDKKGYEEGLYLIGIRHRATNMMLSNKLVQVMAKQLRLKTSQLYTFNSIEEVIMNVKDLTVLHEGYVLNFLPNNLKVKIKGTKYLEAHRFISKLSDKSILEFLGRGEEEELLHLAPEEYRDDIVKKVEYYNTKKMTLVDNIKYYFETLPKTSRKDFAMAVNNSNNNVPQHLKAYLFNLLDNKELKQEQLCNTIAEVEQVSGKTVI